MMRTLLTVLVSCGLAVGCGAPPNVGSDSTNAALLDTLVTLERSALDRWIKLDPSGYLALYAPELTYFDPFTEARIDGLEALRARVTAMTSVKSPFIEPRYEIIGPKVQRLGETAVLTFQLTNYAKLPGQPETQLTRWNSTELYALMDGNWKIIHSHWSFIKPDVKLPGT